MRLKLLLLLFMLPSVMLAQDTEEAENHLFEKLNRGVYKTDDLYSIDKVEVAGSMDQGYTLEVEYTSTCKNSKLEMEVFNRSVSGIFNYELHHKKEYPLKHSLFVVNCINKDESGNYISEPFVRISMDEDLVDRIKWDEDSTSVITAIARSLDYTYF